MDSVSATSSASIGPKSATTSGPTPGPAAATSLDAGANNREELDARQRAEVERLKITDRLVRQREEAQGRLAYDMWDGRPKYEVVVGPDGREYAVDGRLHIDEREQSPEDKLRRARLIKLAALIDVPPSPEGHKQAIEAFGDEAEALREIRREQSQHVMETIEAARSRDVLVTPPGAILNVLA